MERENRSVVTRDAERVGIWLWLSKDSTEGSDDVIRKYTEVKSFIKYYLLSLV